MELSSLSTQPSLALSQISDTFFSDLSEPWLSMWRKSSREWTMILPGSFTTSNTFFPGENYTYNISFQDSYEHGKCKAIYLFYGQKLARYLFELGYCRNTAIIYAMCIRMSECECVCFSICVFVCVKSGYICEHPFLWRILAIML